jgi:hypothetical protein
MSIHQPRVDIFEMMTQVIFLTRDGRVAYCGATAGLPGYLARELRLGERVARGLVLPGAFGRGAGLGPGAPSEAASPCDELLDAMDVLPPQLLVGAFAGSPAGVAQAAVLDMLAGGGADGDAAGNPELMQRLVSRRGKHRASWWTQLGHLSSRAARGTLRNPVPFCLHGVTAVVAAATLGAVFRDIHSKDEVTAGTQDRFGIMFFLVLYLSLLALTSLPLWREEQLLFVAERGSGLYSTSAYVLASMLCDVLPYRLLPPVAFTAISYPLIGLNALPGHQARFFVILVGCNLAVSGVCMLVGVLTNSNASANAAGSLAMLTSLLFSGFLLNKNRIPAAFAWVLSVSPGSYAFEALTVNEFNELSDLYITSTIGADVQKAGPFTGKEIVHCFGFIQELPYDMWMLLGMAVFSFSGVFVSMKLYIKERR